MADGLAASTEDVKGGGLDKLRISRFCVVLLMMVRSKSGEKTTWDV